MINFGLMTKNNKRSIKNTFYHSQEQFFYGNTHTKKVKFSKKQLTVQVQSCTVLEIKVFHPQPTAQFRLSPRKFELAEFERTGGIS